MHAHRIATLLKRKSVEREQLRSRNSKGVLRSPHGEHVFLTVEVDLYPAEYSPTCEPERLHDIVEWICSSGTHMSKRALMRFTSRGVVFEEQIVDFCEQIASSTLYKIKNVKGLWVDPTFRSFIAIVVRCSRSSLMIFVVRIVSGSMAKIVESFHAMKRYTNGGQNKLAEHTAEKHDHVKNGGGRFSRRSRNQYSNESSERNSNLAESRFRRYRSSSIDARFRRGDRTPVWKGRQSRSRDNHRIRDRGEEISSSDDEGQKDDSASPDEESSESVDKSKSRNHESFSNGNGHSNDQLHSESSQRSSVDRRRAGTQSVPARKETTRQKSKKQGGGQDDLSNDNNASALTNSRQMGVQYEELRSNQTTDDLINKSEDYSSLNSQPRVASDSSCNAKEAVTTKETKSAVANQAAKAGQSDSSNQEQHSSSTPPIDALFRELHVVREQLEQLNAPEQGRLRWFETDMEQMKNELRHIRAKLDDCVITYKNDTQLPSVGNSNEVQSYPQRVLKVKRAEKHADIPGDVGDNWTDVRQCRKTKNCNVRPSNTGQDSDGLSSVSAEYENVNYLKRVGNLPGYNETAHHVHYNTRSIPRQHYAFTQLRINNNDPTSNSFQDAAFADRHATAASDRNFGLEKSRNQATLRLPVMNNNGLSHEITLKSGPPLEQSSPMTIPFMTPFFANQLTNPMLTNDRRLLANTLANQFGLPLDSPELAEIVNDQSRYLSGRRTFANIIWNMSAEEEAILRAKSPSPPYQERTSVAQNVHRLELLNKGRNAGNLKISTGDTGILSKGRKKTNKSVTFCLATG